jgi:predicted KAP-like P-loop ATPase
MADNMASHPFSADRPITSRSADLLGRGAFAESLASAIRGWKGLDSLVIALYGPWGAGKSSIKNMMLEALRGSKEDCPSIVEFNPWQWMGPEHLAAAFFHEIGVALGKSDSSKEGKQRAAKWQAYGKYLTLGISLAKPLKAVLSFAGMPEANVVLGPLITGMEESSRVIQEGSDALTAQTEFNERNLSEIKQDLADALKSLKNPVLIVMDDIDRLTAGEIRLLFQLVKANADFPNLVYLLLFSRDRVEQSLGDLTLTDGREFLEKIVQVGFDIPLIERMRLEKVLRWSEQLIGG